MRTAPIWMISPLMSLISGPVTLVTDGQDQVVGSGEDALAAAMSEVSQVMNGN